MSDRTHIQAQIFIEPSALVKAKPIIDAPTRFTVTFREEYESGLTMHGDGDVLEDKLVEALDKLRAARIEAEAERDAAERQATADEQNDAIDHSHDHPLWDARLGRGEPS